MEVSSGFAINTAQLRRNEASAAAVAFHCGRSAKPTLVRRNPGCGDGLVQPAMAARSTAAKNLAALFRQVTRGRHQDPIGIGGIQIALEGPDIGDSSTGELCRESDRDLCQPPMQRRSHDAGIVKLYKVG